MQRSLQNGRQRGSTGVRRQYTQSDSDRGKPSYSTFKSKAEGQAELKAGSWLRFRRVMTDVPRRDHENDVLGDVRRVIADALEVAGNQDEVQGRLDGRRGRRRRPSPSPGEERPALPPG